MIPEVPPPRVPVPANPRAAARSAQAPARRYADFRQFLEAACERGGERIAFRWRPEGAEAERLLSYAELRAEADAIGAEFLRRGFSRGDSVALVSENRPEWCVAYLAIVAAGFVAVPLDAGLDEAGLRRNLEASHARALFLSAKLLRRCPGLASLTDLLLVDFDRGDGEDDLAIGWEAFLARGRSAPVAKLPRPGELGSEARAVIFFTSGTTGIAKGISLSHGAVIANVDAARAALSVDERDVFVALLPLHHTYATTCSFLSAVETACTCVIVDRIAPSAVLRALREGKVSFLIGVPLLFDKVRAGIESELAKLPTPTRVILRLLLGLSRFSALRFHFHLGRYALKAVREKAGLGSVRLAVSGGGPLSKETADFYDALGIEMVQGYGMSENGPLISVNLPGLKDNRSVGFPVRATEVRIEDPDAEGVGEIQVRSPSLMEGYLDNPEATREAFTEDGWLKTGDLGRADRRGFITITGRRKSLIVTEGGKNVYPEEIEGRFVGSPWIKEVLVLGRPVAPGRPGEEVLVVCVPDHERIVAGYDGRSGDSALVESLIRAEIQRINKGLPPYMKSADYIIRDEPFEKTSSQKIKRFLYREYARR